MAREESAWPPRGVRAARRARSRRWLCLGALLLAPLVGGCAASAPAADAPAAPEPGAGFKVDSAQQLGDAEAELALAEQTLAQLFPVTVLEPNGQPVTPVQPSPSTDPLGAGGESRCEVACRALGSMRRSADSVCRLAGAEDPRCELARGRVVKAESRVASAGCRCEGTPG